MKALARIDETLLHDRGTLVREIVANCLAERFTVITAEPGLGVSSLLRAGVEPALQREGFIVAVFDDWPGRLFVTHLKETIAQAVRDAADPLFAAGDDTLKEMLDRIHARTGSPVAILLDQFEDYLRCHNNTVLSDGFDAELAVAVAGRNGVFVVGLQEHALYALERLGALIPNMLGFRIQLQPLSAEAARGAVVSEARGREMEVEPAALDALTAATTTKTGASGIHPFFLKLATGRLLDAESGQNSNIVRASTIEAKGGVDRIVLETFDSAIVELGKTEANLLFRLCSILISHTRQRLSVSEKRLADKAGRQSRYVPALLKRLTEIRLLRRVETPEAVRYEISRECYVPILRDWWERRDAAQMARRRAIFRITSISLAAAIIVVMYLAWMILSPR